MITIFEEYKTLEYIYLNDIYKGSSIKNKKKDWLTIMNRLEKLIGKYIVFDSYKFNKKFVIRGIVKEVSYDNDYNNRVSYIKFQEDPTEWYSISSNEIIMNNEKSDAFKYNL